MNRIYIGVFAYNAIVVVVGYMLLYAFGLARFRRSEWRLLALAYLVGWALLGCLLTFLLIAGVDPEIATVVVVAALCIEASVLVGRRVRKTEIVAHRKRGSPIGTAAAIAGAAALAAVAVTALIIVSKEPWPADWDALWFWLPKAKVIYFLHGLNTGPGGWGAQHDPEYPPLAAVMAAAVSHFAGGFHPAILAFQSVLLGIAFLGGVLALLDRFVPRWLLFPLVALLAVAPNFWSRMQGLLVDQTVAYFIAAAAVACVIWLREPRGAWLGMAIVLLAAATLSKLEGITSAILLVAFMVAGAFVLRRRAGWPALLLLIGPAAIVPWRLWLRSHHLPTSASDYRASDLLRPAFLVKHWTQFTFSSHWIFNSLFNAGLWLVVLPLALFAIALAIRRVPVIAGVVGLWIVVASLGLAAVYWVTVNQPTLNDFALFLNGNVNRVASTIVIVAATLAPLVLGFALAEQDASEEPSPQPAAARAPGAA